jgi:hypothetical protein
MSRGQRGSIRGMRLLSMPAPALAVVAFWDLKKGWYLGEYLHSRADDGVLTTAADLGRWLIALDAHRIVRAPHGPREPDAVRHALPRRFRQDRVSRGDELTPFAARPET